MRFIYQDHANQSKSRKKSWVSRLICSSLKTKIHVTESTGLMTKVSLIIHWSVLLLIVQLVILQT